jgi:tRNA-specific 2-thiouridylase
LIELADQTGVEYVASGHYARVIFDACKSEYQLREADDKSKDQSYFLALLNRNILGRMVFPLGEMKKSDVKTEALKMGLDSAKQEESQDVCFALSKNYAVVIEALRPDRKNSGDMVDVSGKKIGVHKGIHCYTVGQHRGLALNRPDLFVIAIDAAKNQIVVDQDKHLFHSKMKVRGMNWLTDINLPMDCLTKIRYRFEKAECRVEQISDDAVAAVFKKPQRAITPGQAAVFYLEDRVIGGGWIESGWD